MRRPTGVLGEQRRALWHLSWFASVGIALPVLVIALTVLFLPTRSCGSRSYARQNYTFGDPARDQTVAYFFEHVAGGDSLRFVGYDTWPFSTAGEPVLGVALGKLRGSNDLVLFVVTG